MSNFHKSHKLNGLPKPTRPAPPMPECKPPKTDHIAQLERQLDHAISNTERALSQTADALAIIENLKRQNADLLLALQAVKEWDINGWTERGFALPTELRAKIHALLGDTPTAADAAPQHSSLCIGHGQHYDDYAVDCFAELMKEKLAKARAKGRSGWNDPAQCSVEYLNQLLLEHVEKGDPVDVANFCMMLRHYDAKITPRPTAAGAGGQDIKEMVNRFLGWELPETFAPDCFIRFDGERAEQHESWPIGTNLLTADQAKAMFEYCLRSTANSAAHQEAAK